MSNWDHFLNHILKLGIPVEMVQSLSKLLLKHFLLCTTMSIDFNSQIGVGNFEKVGYFTSDSATLVCCGHQK